MDPQIVMLRTQVAVAAMSAAQESLIRGCDDQMLLGRAEILANKMWIWINEDQAT